jgi:HEPN domain-containing protein
MRNTELADAWLKRAVSSLEKAKIGKISDALFYEDLCFDCQQAAEKALKALLIYIGISFPRTHSLNMLIALLKGQNIHVPTEVESAVILNEYALQPVIRVNMSLSLRKNIWRQLKSPSKLSSGSVKPAKAERPDKTGLFFCW